MVQRTNASDLYCWDNSHPSETINVLSFPIPVLCLSSDTVSHVQTNSSQDGGEPYFYFQVPQRHVLPGYEVQEG